MHLIYVNIVGFPGGYLWPVSAERVHGNCFEILGLNDDSEHYPWEFETGQVVECEQVFFDENDDGWVAKDLCRCDQRSG